MTHHAKARRDALGLQLLVGFNGTTPEVELRALIREFAVGGIVLFKRNIESPEGLKALLDEAQAFSMEQSGRPLWVAIDQEGGSVQRLIPPFVQLSGVVRFINKSYVGAETKIIQEHVRRIVGYYLMK